MFGHLDQDQNGTVEISELMDFMQEQQNVDADAISEWADEVDRDLDGTISFEEFYYAMTKTR
jgi:Ca2+-binding EF-hand superfamily protein